jgi:hypothetical protein
VHRVALDGVDPYGLELLRSWNWNRNGTWSWRLPVIWQTPDGVAAEKRNSLKKLNLRPVLEPVLQNGR